MGSIYFGNDKIKKIYLGGQKIKKVYLGSTKVWSGASIVTYICNGSRYTEEIDEGSNAAKPRGFSFNVPNAKFIGWTSIPNSTNPVSSIPATGEPMTLYAIWKYDDVAIAFTKNRYQYATWDYYYYDWNNNVGSFTGNIDTAKYSQISVTAYADLHVRFRGEGAELYLECGGGRTILARALNTWEVPSTEITTRFYNYGTATVKFANSSGNTTLTALIYDPPLDPNYSSVYNAGGELNAYVEFSNARLTGRTKVG